MLCSGIQYNIPHFQINTEIDGLQNIPNFLFGLYYQDLQINQLTDLNTYSVLRYKKYSSISLAI